MVEIRKWESFLEDMNALCIVIECWNICVIASDRLMHCLSFAVPRAGVFQPKVKARVRKGGGRGDAGASVAVKAPPAAPAAEKPVSALPVASDTEPLDGNQNNAEENEISQPDFKVPDAPLSIEENCVPEPLLPITSSTTTLEETVGVIDSVSTEVTKVTSPSRTSSIEPAIHSSPAAEDGSLLLQAEDDVIAAINAPEVSPPVAVRSVSPDVHSTPFV